MNRWFRWDLRYYYWNKIKDFWTLKANKPDWHQVIVTYDNCPDGFFGFPTSRLYYDGNLVDEIKHELEHNNYSFSLWFNPKTNLPFLGREYANKT